MNETEIRLERVKKVLIEEGFSDTRLQIQKPDQIFGLVKKINNIWEIHFRGFEDGHLEPEMEVSRDYLEHLDDRYRRPAINELTEILDNYNIPYKKTDETQLDLRIECPSTLIEWKPLLDLSVLFIGVLFIPVILLTSFLKLMLQLFQPILPDHP
jgi:hypothetical protein